MLIAFLLFTFNAMKSSLCVGHTGKSATSFFFMHVRALILL